MLRFAGIVLVMIAAVLLGVTLSRSERRRQRSVAFSLEIVSHVRREIALYATPVPQLFLHYTPPHTVPEIDLSLPLENALAPLYPSLGKYASLMRRFARKLGDGYKEDMLALCEDTASQLNRALEEMKHEVPARCRMYMALPILLAVSVLILLL